MCVSLYPVQAVVYDVSGIPTKNTGDAFTAAELNLMIDMIRNLKKDDRDDADVTNDRFGFGLVGNPTSMVDVNGTVTATAFDGDGSALTNLPNPGLWSQTASDIYYNSGKVAIGINSSPVWDFEVHSTSAGSANFLVEAAGANNANIRLANANQEWFLHTDGTTNNFEIKNRTSGDTKVLEIDASTNNSTFTGDLTSDGDIYATNFINTVTGNPVSGKFVDGTDTDDAAYLTGNVGIGIADPERSLHVVFDTGEAPRFERATGSSGNNVNNVMQLFRTNAGGVGADGIGGQFSFHLETETEGVVEEAGKISVQATDATAGTIDSRVQLIPFKDGAGVDNAFTVNSDGNVGIGTTLPANKLTVSTGEIWADLTGVEWPLDIQTSGEGELTSGKGFGLRVRGGNNLNKGIGIAAFAPNDNYANDVDMAFYTGTSSAFSEKMRLKSDGDLGIGTTQPSEELHVRKDQEVPTAIYVQNESTGTGTDTRAGFGAKTEGNQLDVIAYGPNAVGNLGGVAKADAAFVRTISAEPVSSLNIGTGGTVPLNLFTGDTTRVTVLGNGNVGIGTDNPRAALEVFDGDIRVGRTGDTGNHRLRLRGSSFELGYDTTTSQTGLPGAYISTADVSKSIQLAPAGSTALIVTGSGNVGIGTTTPTVARLQVENGHIAVDENNNNDYGFITQAGSTGIGLASAAIYLSSPQLYVFDDSVGVGDLTPDGGLKLDVEGKVGATEYCDEAGANCSTATDVYNTVTSGGGKFQDGATSGEIYYNGGNVGIGTVSPDVPLDVEGSIDISNNDTALLRFRNTADNDHASLGLLNGGLSLSGHSNATTDSHLFIRNSNGNVGIGTTAPAAKLEVSATGGDALYLRQETNGAGAKIKFTDRSTEDQSGTLEYVHTDGASYGAGNAFKLYGTEAELNLHVDGGIIAADRLWVADDGTFNDNRTVELTRTATGTSTQYGIENYLYYNGTQTVDRTHNADFNRVVLAGNNGGFNKSGRGIWGEVETTGSTTSYINTGIYGTIDHNSTGTMGEGRGLASLLDTAAGTTITTGTGLYTTIDNDGTMTNYYGIYIHDVIEGTQTNAYALWANEGDFVLDGDGNGVRGGTNAGSDLFFGESQDAAIWYDGTDLNIDPDIVGSGQVEVRGDLAFAGDLRRTSGTLKCPTGEVLFGFDNGADSAAGDGSHPGLICEEPPQVYQ